MNCDPIARWYRTLEYLVFGRALERRRLEYLDEISSARRILVLGDGDGRFTAALLERNPSAEVDSVDLSAAMLDLAARRCRHSSRVRFHKADARRLEWRGSYDLVVTHFFLDCLTDAEVRGLVQRVSAALCPDARWLLSEFHVPQRVLARWLARMLVAFLYLCFRFSTGLEVRRLPDHAAAMKARGFRRMGHKAAAGGLLISELWQFCVLKVPAEASEESEHSGP